MKTKTTPTIVQYGSLQDAYDYFNKELFGGELPQCMIVFGENRENRMGFFHAEQWEKGKEKAHTIALTPMYLARGAKEVLGTLVHEMAHLWQEEFGEASRSGYHNKEWGNKMKEIGLHPSDTGKVGGKETGQQMTHYVMSGGGFEVSYKAMPEDIKLPWVGVPLVKKSKRPNSKVRYECPGCGLKCWAKPESVFVCGECEEELVP